MFYCTTAVETDRLSSRALLCWREQKALSRDFVLSKKYFPAGVRWAYDRAPFLHFPEWTDARQHDCSCRRRRARCTLFFSRLTTTLGTRVVPDGSKVNWFGEACLRGSDWGAVGPPWASSAKCSPVSHTDTLVFALSTIGSSAVSWKNKK